MLYQCLQTYPCVTYYKYTVCRENSAASSVDCHHRTFTLDDEEVERDEVVFFGPVGHTEQCIAVAVEEKAKVCPLCLLA